MMNANAGLTSLESDPNGTGTFIEMPVTKRVKLISWL
jgi:hypothetical protein